MKSLMFFIISAVAIAFAWVTLNNFLGNSYYGKGNKSLIPHISELKDLKKYPQIAIEKNRFVSPRQRRAVQNLGD